MIIKIIQSIFCRHDYRLFRIIQRNPVHQMDPLTKWKCLKCERVVYSRYMDYVE